MAILIVLKMTLDSSANTSINFSLPVAKAPRHKRHRASVRGFLDVEAAVGDDDEEEEDEGDEFFDGK